MKIKSPKLFVLTALAAMTAAVITVLVSASTIWFVRSDGGTITQCTGQADAAYPGTGSAQPCAYNNPQDAVNAAALGDTINLRAGDTFTGNFTLPLKSGNSFLTIQSTRASELPPDTRVSPGQTALMSKLESTNVGPVIATPDLTASHHYQFIGVEFSLNADTGFSTIRLGDGAQTSLAQVPDSITLDRCYIHGQPTLNSQAGITINASNVTVSNSYISEIHWAGVQSYGIGAFNGPGPFTITNNYIEAAGLNIIFGGARPAINNLVPSDIVITGNHLFKKLSWRVGDPSYAGIHWTIVNLLELKNARNTTISNNILENSWPDAQIGWAIILNAFKDGGWEAVDDVTLSCNRIINTTYGIDLRGIDAPDTVLRMHRITIADNSLEGLSSFTIGSNGTAFQLLNGGEDIVINHNIVAVATGGTLNTALALSGSTPATLIRPQFINNIVPHGSFGIFGDGGTFGTDAFNAFSSDYTFTKNGIIATPPDLEPKYATNYFPANLAQTVGLLGNDNVQIGVRAPCVAPTPTPTVTPTPTPIPTPTPTPTPGPGGGKLHGKGKGKGNTKLR